MSIVVVGAGIAGLSVAEGLLDRGNSVILLERYPNVGGRIVTHRDPQYEIGAGRIHASHKRVHSLIKRFGLHTYPISDKVVYRPLSTCKDEPHGLDWILPAIIRMLKGQSKKTLASHTLSSLLSPEWRTLLLRFPYWAEVHMLRADLALESFEAEMGTYGGYVGIQEGIDALTSHLLAVVKKKGADVRVRHRVEDIRQHGDGFVITGEFGKKAEAKPFRIETDQVIIATCRCSLGKFSVLKGLPLLKQLQTSGLTRIYAQYPASKEVWWAGMEKTVTDSPLRFVIPIDPRSGLIMISYTDGPDTYTWKGLEGPKLNKAIQKEVKRLFPEKVVEEPTFLEKHEWPSGCTYWVPGEYEVEKAIQKAMHPRKGLWIVGESVAKHQAWIESALHSVEDFLHSEYRI
jgi:monoamine oxidase